jgi:outer membrane lipoprotein-sorting protein
MRNSRRWIVPGTVVAVLVGASTVPHAFASGPGPNLPTVSAADLIASVRTTSVEALSGTIQVDADLGLPTLPDHLVGASSGAATLLTGSHTLRLWVDGADRQRLALLDDLAETDVIHNGMNLWTYDSSTNAVTHRLLPSGSSADSAPVTTELTPPAAAQQALRDLDPSTAVAVTGTSRVAGRPTYQLTVTPRTTDTLVRSVRIDVDADNRIPLRVQIFGAGSQPAWSTGFTSGDDGRSSGVSFATPPASEFQFTVPSGATVTQSGGTPRSDGSGPANPDPNPDQSGARPQPVGAGWATVLEFPAADLNVAGGSADPDSAHHDSVLRWLERSATVVPEGRLISTSLVSLLITPDGRALVGAVPPAVVRAAAAQE